MSNFTQKLKKKKPRPKEKFILTSLQRNFPILKGELPVLGSIHTRWVREIYGNDSVVRAIEILTGNIEGFVSHALDPEVELHGAELALAVTVAGVAITREAH